LFAGLFVLEPASSSAHIAGGHTWPRIYGSKRSSAQDTKRCSELSEKERRKTERCKTDEERREDEQKKKDEEIAEKEKPTKTSFWKHVHLDLPGIRADNGNGYVCCSAIGVHLTAFEVKRLQIYGPPGLLLVRQQVGPDEWQWRAAYSWGVGYYLGTATLPFVHRPGKFYFNLTKIWTTQSASMETLGASSNESSMAALSVVFAK
jgi:hypothetical protein